MLNDERFLHYIVSHCCSSLLEMTHLLREWYRMTFMLFFCAPTISKWQKLKGPIFKGVRYKLDPGWHRPGQFSKRLLVWNKCSFLILVIPRKTDKTRLTLQPLSPPSELKSRFFQMFFTFSSSIHFSCCRSAYRDIRSIVSSLRPDMLFTEMLLELPTGLLVWNVIYISWWGISFP